MYQQPYQQPPQQPYQQPQQPYQQQQPPQQPYQQQPPQQQAYQQQPPQQHGYQAPPPPIHYQTPTPPQQGYQAPKPTYQTTPPQQGSYQQPSVPSYQTPTQQGGYQPHQPQQQQPYTPGQQYPSAPPYYTQQYTTQDPQVMNYFRSADKNNTGTIDQYELKTALSQCGFVFDDELARRLIRMFDKNLNTRIDGNEFVQLYQYLMQMKNAFHAVDTNKNGMLEYHETEQALRQGGYNINSGIVARLFKSFDIQCKGSLNFDGYLKLCVFLGTLKQGFGAYDNDRNGVVQFNFDQYVDSCVLLS
jgi:Ca2+-binding EF-hand superfamily protein